ncbi:hypothetical protein [Oricola sp.]|uniref:hypothetical protein n=1 Tax=Oricola sp. TaxID=1979950 RepID=UPI003BACA64E
MAQFAEMFFGDFEVTPYAGVGFVGGAKYNISGFAGETATGGLINPAFQLEVSAEGRVYYGGVDVTNRPSVKEWLDRQGDIQPGFYRDFAGLSVEVGQVSVEGRSAFNGSVDNFGIPGVGDAFGSFVNSPGNITGNAGVDYQETYLKLETRLGRYWITETPSSFAPRAGLSIAGLAGLHLAGRNTDIRHNVDASFPAFGVNGILNARYFTDVEDNGVIPYLGVDFGQDWPLKNGAVLRTGITARGGLSFNRWNAVDTLSAEGLGSIDRYNHANLKGSSTSGYGSVSGHVGVDFATGWSAQVDAGIQHGLIRSPKVFRPDSVEVSPGNFELRDPDISFDAETTYTLSFSMRHRF